MSLHGADVGVEAGDVNRARGPLLASASLHVVEQHAKNHIAVAISLLKLEGVQWRILLLQKKAISKRAN